MLRKLLKYYLKWIYKVIVVFYILAVIFSIIGRVLSLIENSIVFSAIAKFTYGLAIAMMANCLINCFTRLWSRFVKNIYKDESYLTHTLPVEKKKIYISKVIAALITVFTTAVVILFCLFICYYSKENLENLKAILELTASTYNTTVIGLILLMVGVFFLEVMFIVLIGYVSIILGYKSNKNKNAKTIIIGTLLYLLTQAVTLVLIFILGLFNSNVMNLINTKDIVNIDSIKVIMLTGVAIYITYIIIYYLLGKRFFIKGVNIE